MTDPQRDPNAEARAIVSELNAVLFRLYQLDPTVIAADELTFQRLGRCVDLVSNWYRGAVYIRNGLDLLGRDDDHSSPT